MDAGDLRSDVLSRLEENGEPVTYRDLLRYVTAPGDCINCMESPLRKAVLKLLDEGTIALTVPSA